MIRNEKKRRMIGWKPELSWDESTKDAPRRFGTHAVLGLALLWIVCATGCAKQPPQQPEAVTQSVEPAQSTELHPVAVVDETEAYLGVLEAKDKVEKRFAIRNEGDRPLILKRGGTSCTCTMSALPEEPILPGHGAIVVVSTKSEEKDGSFDHTATVLTNDPDNRRIVFRIYGKFQQILAFEPPKLSVSSMRDEDGGKAIEVETIAYSEVFRNFELASVSSTLDGLSWEIEPASELDLESLQARCGYRLKLKIPPSADKDDFLEKLTIEARSDDDPPITKEASCTIYQNVLPRADIAGKNLGYGRILNIGSLRPWQGATERLTLTVRDEHRKLEVKSIEKDPGFLEVEVVPMVPENPESGLYWVNVTVPIDAPTSNHVGSRKGEIRIITDHPALPVMSFFVQFAVTSG